MVKIDSSQISPQQVRKSVISCKKFNRKFSDVPDSEWKTHLFASNDPYRIPKIINQIISYNYKSLPIKLLDIGFGYGYVTKPIIDHLGDQVDVSVLEHPELDRVHSPVFQNTFEKNNITLYQQDLDSGINIEDSFDVIVLGEVAEHLSPTTFNSIIDDLHSICSGCLIITTPNLLSVTNRRKFLFGQDIFDSPVIDEDDASHDHIYMYSMNMLSHMLCTNGFNVEYKEYLSGWPHKTRRAVYEKDIIKIAYNFIESMVQYLLPTYRQRILIRASA